MAPAQRGVDSAPSVRLVNLCLRVHLPVNLAGVNYAGRGAQTTERKMVAAEGAWTLAFNRFGFGARPGAVRLGDPRQALVAELSAEEGARIERCDLLSTPQILQAVYDDDWRRKQERDRQDAARLAAPTDDLLARLMDLYDHSDPALAKALQAGLDADRLANRQGMDAFKPGGDVALLMRKAAEGAARLMAADDGPRVGALAFDGWDTHANEGGATGRLAQLLGGLDGAFAAVESELGPRWNDTVVVAITEFGRTARINGAVGADHGTATIAFLAGGALAGGRVVADWPGLRVADLYEQRDLKPTTDLRAVLKGVLGEHLGLSADVLAHAVFPDTLGVASMKGLIAA
jgi:hypothetical protein